MSAGLAAIGAAERCRLDRLAGTGRTACGRHGTASPLLRARVPLARAKRCLCEVRSLPAVCRETTLADTIRAQPGQETGTVRLLEARPPRSSMLNSLALEPSEIIKRVAGRLPLCAGRPTHPRAEVM